MRQIRLLFVSVIFSSVMMPFATPVFAILVPWTIDVTVTAAPGGLIGVGPQYTFGATFPQFFSGTFTADDTLAGSISSLSLTIGAVVINASNFPVEPLHPNSFNPITGQLTTRFQDGRFIFNPSDGPPYPFSAISEVYLGTGLHRSSGGMDFGLSGFSMISGTDWTGVTMVSRASPNTTVPEPASMLLLSTGLLGLAGYRWHQRRRGRIPTA